MKKWIGIVFVLLVGILFAWRTAAPEPVQKQVIQKVESKEELAAERFITSVLMEEDGRIRTNLTDFQDQYLSETVGLWMMYLLEKGDFAAFQKQVDVLKTFFLNKDYLVTWEITGNKKSRVNAGIDDLRIMTALYQAGEQWDESAYTQLAEKMAAALVKYQLKDGWLVDFVDLKNKKQGDTLTMSYLIPEGVDLLAPSAKPASLQMKELLRDTPVSPLGFYPKAYNISSGNFQFDEEINMIDQLYTGYHRVRWGGNADGLLQFVKSSFQRDGKLYGRYSAETGLPAVDYEAVAVYALATLLCMETGDTESAGLIFQKMKTFQQTEGLYAGGYADHQTGETHTFDNLLALLAERKVVDENIWSN